MCRKNVLFHSYLLALLAGLLLSLAPVANAAVLNVYLLAGQSNMEGQTYTYNSTETANWNVSTMEFLLSGSPAATAYLANLPFGFKDSLDAGWLNPRNDVWAVHYYSGNGTVKDVLPSRNPADIVSGIQPLMPGFGVNTNFGSMFGAELGMGIRLGNALQSPVFLFKSDRGGTTLGNDWRPPSAVAARGGVVGPEYVNTMARFVEFLDALDADLADDNVLNDYGNVTGYVVAGVFWLQGWNEQYDDSPYTGAELQAEYADNLKDLIYSIRAADARIPNDLPLVIGESSDQNAVLNAARQAAVTQLNAEIPGSAAFFDTDNMIGVDWGDNDRGEPFSQGWGYHFHARAENFLEIGWKAAGSVLDNGFYLEDTSDDVDPPTPDPMTWASVPAAIGSSSITMTATTATDSSGVEYYFTCTTGGGNDSGWQPSPVYEDTGLTPETAYTYTVTARDKSTNQNTTAASTGESATTDAPDVTLPTPDPMTWATVPYATSHASIAMVATTASDPSGVEYYFTCIAGGGNDSGWQDSDSYTDLGLTPNTQYTYTVIARDKSVNQNATAASTAESATTEDAPPITANLEGYWPFDGDALDGSGNGHDGTLVNAPGYTTGKLDQAIDLVGPSDQYITAALPTSISPPWTVSVWVNKQGEPQNYGASGLLDGGYDPDPDQTTWYGLRLESYKSGDPSKVGMCEYGADTHNSYWDYAVTTGEWVHLVFIGTDAGATLYADGVSQGVLAVPASDPVWIDRIGKTYHYNCPMDAYIDDLAIWSRVLSANEIAHLYNNGNGNPVIDVTTIPDTFPPNPNPATFAIDPTVLSLTEITMMATTGSDVSGPVEYYFAEISGNPGGTGSGWVTHPVYTDAELTPNTQYTYTVQMRDVLGNTGTVSAEVSTITTVTIAKDQTFTMRAAELLALPITLAGVNLNGNDDDLTYTIVSNPSNGILINTGDRRIEYLPDSTFRGIETFTYRASDGVQESNIATVTVNVIQEACTSAQAGNGPTDSLYVHVPSHLVTADISTYQHVVSLTGDTMHESASSDPAIAGHVPFVSRNDLTNKSIMIDLGETSRNVPLSISFKLIPTDSMQNELVMQAGAFDIETSSGSMISTWYNTGTGETSVTNNNSVLKNRSCNHFALVLGDSSYTTYFNGYPTTVAADTSMLRDLDGSIVIGPFPGKVWDIRVYQRALGQAEIMTLGGADSSDELLAASPYEGYPNYLFGVYVNEWWPDHATDPFEEFQYYVHSQDRVYERNIFEAGMYPNNDLSGYFASGNCRTLQLSDGIRKTFVKKTFSDPLTQSNAQHWLHENFHSYQGQLRRYSGIGGSKFMLESTASWGAAHNIPAVKDTLLGYYTLHPHLPLWTIQNSPVDMRAGWQFKGGHQYGANIFWSYLTNYAAGKNMLGDCFNDTRVGSRPAEAAYDLLATQGLDMKSIFADYAARITTWDIQDGPAYLRSEKASLSRMKGAKPDAEIFDAKMTTTYDSKGTGDEWTDVPELHIPGSWAFNAYRVEVSQDADYTFAVKTDGSNPAYSDFQARVVVHDLQTDERTYHVLSIAAPGEASSIIVPARAGDDLYLIVATTPEVFSGWDWYPYQFKILARTKNSGRVRSN